MRNLQQPPTEAQQQKTHCLKTSIVQTPAKAILAILNRPFRRGIKRSNMATRPVTDRSPASSSGHLLFNGIIEDPDPEHHDAPPPHASIRHQQQHRFANLQITNINKLAPNLISTN
ncbi:uncharacterized protein LOC134216048 [Armigeres subalbatus]|uniref:uncharacterized protein LOC134216048 n=1 Tax=Armigeres subalbatus TaxID=124917 RepID=UPI002ED498D5